MGEVQLHPRHHAGDRRRGHAGLAALAQPPPRRHQRGGIHGARRPAQLGKGGVHHVARGQAAARHGVEQLLHPVLAQRLGRGLQQLLLEVEPVLPERLDDGRAPLVARRAFSSATAKRRMRACALPEATNFIQAGLGLPPLAVMISTWSPFCSLSCRR
jgi:hypothetical protein